MNKQMFRHGWIKDKIDTRDLFYSAALPPQVTLPKKVDLTSQQPPVYDQETLGSCVGNGVGSNIHFCLLKELIKNFPPSRLMIYFMAREMEGTVNEDPGCQIRDAIKAVVKNGVCSEYMWPYDITRFTVKPPVECYEQASLHQVIKYERVAVSLTPIKTCLASGFPVVFGATIYNSFMSDKVMKTGDVPNPSWLDYMRGSIGGHCMVICGYDDSTERFTIKNSWGVKVGKAGFFTMSYSYVSNPKLCADFWKISFVEKNGEAK